MFKNLFTNILNRIDWVLFFASTLLLAAGLVTMSSFVGDNPFFNKQIIWIAISLGVFFTLSFLDLRFLKRTDVLVSLFIFFCILLTSLFFLGDVVRGARSWFSFGAFSFQPSDPMKIIVILVLAKYFSRRHVEIAHIRHILISGIYAFIPFLLIFLQPDFGSAIIIFLIWLGMILVSGVSRKHILGVIIAIIIAIGGLWLFAFEDYQKQRVISFLNPLTDIRGTGYNAYQSTIAIGSGEIFGKGIGYGTQSRLKFLPEYQTDFIFAAFVEEWGFIGAIILFIAFGVVIWRILANALVGDTNFEMLFGMGVAILFMSHFIINIGMNIGLLPVTGTTIPFLSYGGSHLLTEFIGLGILMGMRGYSRITHRDNIKNEFLGM